MPWCDGAIWSHLSKSYGSQPQQSTMHRQTQGSLTSPRRQGAVEHQTASSVLHQDAVELRPSGTSSHPVKPLCLGSELVLWQGVQSEINQWEQNAVSPYSTVKFLF